MTGNTELVIPPLCADVDRLAALYRYHILDTAPESQFDDLTRLIAYICKAPIAVINFIDRDRQFFKSEIGLGVRELPLQASICARIITEPEVVVIPDTRLDPRFAENPLVVGHPNLRFYAGATLRSHDGQPLGTLCVLDYTPRELDAAQLDALQSLANVVMSQLELRRTLRAQSGVISERERAKLQLERTVTAKDQFLAELSHELRTPLNPILMTASAMESDPRLPPALLEDVRTIRRSAELERRLIDDLLDLTRINRGKLELRPARVSVRTQLQQALRMLAGDVATKRLNLEFNCTAERDFVEADPDRLQQIACNLLRNAIKFTPERGTVTLTTRDAINSRIEFEVRDTGIGIDADRLPNVFNAYEQGDRSVTRRFGGLGLGLAICKALVESQSGSIRCTSEGPGLGSVFTVSLPAAAAPIAVDPAAAGPSVVAEQRKRRILLVEDNEATARVMARLLRHMSHDVSTAASMVSAIETADRAPFDLVISDVGLPDGSGLDLMRELKQRYGLTGIAVTGYGMEEDIRHCKEAGFTLHLTKPISAQQLQAAIEQLN